MILQALAFSLYTGLLFTFFNRHARFGKKVAPAAAGLFFTPPEGERTQVIEEHAAHSNSLVKEAHPSNATPVRNDYHTRVGDIAQAIQISSKYIPWKNVCRHQAYQAKLLCNFYKIPYRIFIGFKKDKEKNEIQAHAWTVAGGRIITGFCNPEEYTVQSIYSN